MVRAETVNTKNESGNWQGQIPDISETLRFDLYLMNGYKD